MCQFCTWREMSEKSLSEAKLMALYHYNKSQSACISVAGAPFWSGAPGSARSEPIGVTLLCMYRGEASVQVKLETASCITVAYPREIFSAKNRTCL